MYSNSFSDKIFRRWEFPWIAPYSKHKVSSIIIPSSSLCLCTLILISASLLLPTGFFPHRDHQLEQFHSFFKGKKPVIFFFLFNFLFSSHSMKHCSKEKEKCSFLFCVGENQGKVSEHLPCSGGTLLVLLTRVDGDSVEPFVPHTHRWFQLSVGLGFVCCCPLGAKKTPKALSHTTANRMKHAKPVSTSGCFHSDSSQVFCLKKETASVTYQLANFQGVPRFTSTWLRGSLHCNL